MSYQLFISGGCSASFTHPSYIHRSWPVHVAQLLGCEHQNVALPSQGNGMISRRVLYTVEQALKSMSAQDIIVGIFWSDSNRHEFYTDQHVTSRMVNQSQWENPTSIQPYDPSSSLQTKNWILIGPNCTEEYAKTHYRMFHSYIDSQIKTCEHVLRTQWYLEKNKIKYFMGTYTNNTFDKNFIDHPEVSWLYNQINQHTLIPIVGMLEWAIKLTDPELKFNPDDICHLNTPQSKAFTDQVIWPFLKEKNYV
jgi:hypothetical protein